MDPDHPGFDPERDPQYADVIPALYRRYDQVVGRAFEAMGPDTLLLVMSDHGFTSWRRSFHLNSWLREEGFLAVRDPNPRKDRGLFSNVDWSRTRAYGLGLNGLYVNLDGRETTGIVPEFRRLALMEEIRDRLLAYVDPETGSPAVTSVYLREECFEDGGFLDVGPDIVVGYAKMTRGSNESALGEVPREVMADNDTEWSGDHGMDHETVPGILLTSRPLARPATGLEDLAASILAELGVDRFPDN
jgi:predicted AlkP superfamily phosphohydrolase/phosphomutase